MGPLSTISIVMEGILLGVLSAFILVLVSVLADLTTRHGGLDQAMDEEEFAEYLAQKVNDWIEATRANKGDFNWWPKYDMFDYASDKFHNGDF